jgi:2-methylfumaryl-CoA isomerase
VYDLLKGMRIVEGASFVAAPLCGQTFVQLGADVIRFDPIGGGPDFGRWPLAPNGLSYYWENLNKGKRSVAIDLKSEAGRELAIALATAGGDDGGYFVTNYPANGFLSHERLAGHRPDLISVRVAGSSDGRNAFDYTINCATGYPYMTGPTDYSGPVNHVLPAWDVTTGLYAAVSLLAADRDRRQTGKGREIVVPLSNVAFSVLSTLGHVAEVQTSGKDRPRYGNALYGSFGRDFVTRDGRNLMITAMTTRQWKGLITVLEIESDIRTLERTHAVDFMNDEGARFIHREAIFALVGSRVATHNFEDLKDSFDRLGVGWGLYQTVGEAMQNDPRLSVANPMFEMQKHPSGASYLTPGFPGDIRAEPRLPVPSGPRLGEHTDEVLAEVMGLSAARIGELHDAGIVAGPEGQPVG